MAKTQDKKRKQDLGIFYTPQEVVSFVFDILKIWKDKENKEAKRWQSRKPHAHFPSVIDPACGEGVFLKNAVTSDFTGYNPTEKTPYVFGIDLDGDVVNRWEKISILHDLFKGNKNKMLNHFHQQDGLLELPEKVFNYKTGGLKEFDAVVGNPPYGGMGFSSLKDKNTKETIEILERLKKFEILGYRKRKNEKENGQSSLWGDFTWGSIPWGGGSRIPDTKEVESIPIEILFLDRFIQLAKPGGWIAIIIPDGILTNSNSHYVRKFLSDKTKVEAIISLPRETFKNVGTNAKTSILFLRKLKEKEKPEQNYKVFLASVEKINQDNFDLIVKSYQKLYNLGGNPMNKSDLINVTKNQSDEEVVMVRTDKKLSEMLDAKPYSRLNVDFWHPQFDQIYEDLAHFSGKVVALKSLLENQEVISCDHVRASRKEQIGSFKTAYFTVDFIMPNGYDTSSLVFASDNSYKRLQRSSLKQGDIAIAGSGQGSVGKSFVYRYLYDKAIVGDLFIIRTTKSISPYYLQVYLQTKYGKMQIQRFESGVSGQTHINKQEIEEFLIPLINSIVQEQIESLYQQMAVLFDEAIDNKKNNHTSAYEEKLVKSTNILNNLISRTEEVIMGKRDDIN